MKSNRNRSSLFLKTTYGVLAALTLSACQTAPVDANRSPAQIDEKRFKLLQSDVAEMIGIYARSVFLDKSLARLDMRKKLVSPHDMGGDPGQSGVSLGLTLYTAGGTALGFILRSFLEGGNDSSSEYNLDRYLGKSVADEITSGGASKSLLIGSSFGASFAGSLVLGSDPRYFDKEGVDDTPGVAWLMLTFRKNDMDKDRQERADSSNAYFQAEFVAELKKTAADISTRVGQLYQLNKIETTMFSHRLQEKLVAAYSGKKTWGPDDKIHVDVNRLVRQVLPDGEARIKAVTYVLADAVKSSRGAIDLNSSKDIQKWFEKSITSLRKLEDGAVKVYEQLEDSSDKDRRAMMPNYIALAEDIDAFVKKMTVHAKLF